MTGSACASWSRYQSGLTGWAGPSLGSFMMDRMERLGFSTSQMTVCARRVHRESWGKSVRSLRRTSF